MTISMTPELLNSIFDDAKEKAHNEIEKNHQNKYTNQMHLE